MLNEQKKNQLPPIIVDYIEKLLGKGSSNFQRENYCMMLEGIRNAVDDAIRKHKTNNKLYNRK